MPNLIPHFIHEQFSERQHEGVFEAATLSVDVSGFTILTETLLYREKQVAEVLTDVLNRIFSPLVENVYAHGGFVANFAGDAFLAFFPLNEPDGALHAIQSALFLQQFFRENGKIETEHGNFTLGARVGISAGRVEWGIVGQDTGAPTLAFYFRGDAVDSCKRGEQSARSGQIIADEPILSLMANGINTDPLSDTLAAAPVSLPLRPVKVEDLTTGALVPFVQDSVLDSLSGNVHGEFRQVAPVFISFDHTHPHSMSRFVPDMIRLAHEYGGYFNKLDFDEIGGLALVIFGAPLTHENDLIRAGDFLLALRKMQPDVPWRSGMTFGTAYAGLVGGQERSEYTVIGDIVNLACRIMQTAAWGQSWLSANTARMVNAKFILEPAGEHLFRGFSSRRLVYDLRGTRSKLDSLYLYTGRMLGREREIERLRKFARPLSRGRFAGLMIIIGEPGIGKSRLAHEFIHEWQATYPGNKPLWLLSPADEILRQSFNPFRYALQTYFNQEPNLSEAENRARFDARLDALIDSTKDPNLRNELARTRPFLAMLFGLPSPGSLYDELDPRLRFENTLIALSTFLCAESLRQPVMIQLEDAQNLDVDSMAFLQRFSRSLSGEGAPVYPIAILATSRKPLSKEVFDPSAPNYHMHLESLPGDMIASLAADILEQPVSPELVYLLAERGEGNPFFIEHLLDYLKGQELIIPGPNGLRPIMQGVILPADVRAALVSRIDRLPRDVRQVIQAASVLGREFNLVVLAHMLNDDETLAEKIKTAERENILYGIGNSRYIFAHALLRDAAYQIQLHSRRRELHKKALQTIEIIFADNIAPHYEELAYHAEISQNIEKQRLYFRKAGEAAQADYRNELALNYYTKLQSLLDTPADEIEIHRKIADVLQLIGNLESAREHLRDALSMAERSRDSDSIAHCQLGLGMLARTRSQYTEALTWMERARARWEALGNLRNLNNTMIQMAIVHWRKNELDTAEAYLEKSAVLSDELGDLTAKAHVVNNRGNIFWSRAEFDTAREYYKQALAISRELKDRLLIARSLNNLALVATEQDGEYGRDALHEASLNLSRQIGNKSGEAISLNNIGWNLKKLGRIREARELFEQGYAIHRTLGDKYNIALSLNNLGLCRLEENNFPVARQWFEEDVVIYRELKDRGGLSNALNNLGLSEFNLGNTSRAETLFRESLSIRYEMKQVEGIKFSLIGLAGVSARLGQHEQGVSLLAISEQDNAELEPPYVRVRNQAVSMLKAALGENEFERIWKNNSEYDLWIFIEQILKV